MSIFSNINRFFGGTDLASTEAELAAAQARIEELENQPAEVVVETVEIEVPVPQEMVTAVLCQWNQKTSHMTVDEYAAYAGMPVKEFISQRFPAADLTRLSQLAVVDASGAQTTLSMDGVMPAEAPAEILAAQTSGRGE